MERRHFGFHEIHWSWNLCFWEIVMFSVEIHIKNNKYFWKKCKNKRKNINKLMNIQWLKPFSPTVVRIVAAAVDMIAFLYLAVLFCSCVFIIPTDWGHIWLLMFLSWCVLSLTKSDNFSNEKCSQHLKPYEGRPLKFRHFHHRDGRQIPHFEKWKTIWSQRLVMVSDQPHVKTHKNKTQIACGIK